MMDWKDIEAQLRTRVLETCQHLLPNGKREGNEWVCGSVAGEAGKSLKVSLAKPGLWTDFAGDSGGNNLMGLWSAVRGVPFRQAINEVKAWLGIRDDFEKRVRNYAKVTDQQPETGSWENVNKTWQQCQPLTVGGPVWEYLVEQRKIAATAIE